MTKFLWQKDVDSYSFIVNCGDEDFKKNKLHTKQKQILQE
jgi:hypothetical protein